MSQATRSRMRVVKASLATQPRRHACTLVLTDLGDGAFDVRGTFERGFQPESPAHCAMKVLLDLYVPMLGERMDAPVAPAVVEEAAIAEAMLAHVSVDPASVGEDRTVSQILDASGSPLTH